jgi:hypothetical protein
MLAKMTSLLQSASRASSEPEILASIHNADVNLAIWERSAPANLEVILKGDTRDVRFACDLGGLEAQLVSELDKGGYNVCPEREDLVADIASLARAFCGVMAIAEVDVRLEVVTTDACRKFHGDYVKARLITTYLGEGTQWLDETDADRISRGVEPLEIRQLGTGDVGVFKGKLATERPAIHRSPPIGNTGQKRFLLVLNPA